LGRMLKYCYGYINRKSIINYNNSQKAKSNIRGKGVAVGVELPNAPSIQIALQAYICDDKVIAENLVKSIIFPL